MAYLLIMSAYHFGVGFNRLIFLIIVDQLFLLCVLGKFLLESQALLGALGHG